MTFNGTDAFVDPISYVIKSAGSPIHCNDVAPPEVQSTVYADERDRCKQYHNFIPVIDTALFSTAMDRGLYNAAINKISTSAD